ncbi:MAG: hypothetical protein H6773_02035 [Pseudomonadales bacterium]|nr:hypothetical protein [Pseudomonadales bacterium]
MTEKIEYVLDDVGRCSIRAITGAYEHFHGEKLRSEEEKRIENVLTNFFKIVQENESEKSHFVIAQIAKALVSVSKSLNLETKNIAVNVRTKLSLIESEVLDQSEIERLITSSAYPPFYVVTGNGISRHVEFITDIEKFQKHAEECKKNFGDQVELLIEVRSN